MANEISCLAYTSDPNPRVERETWPGDGHRCPLSWDDVVVEANIVGVRRTTYRVGSLRGRRHGRRRVRIGTPDPSLTPVAGMVAVTELVERLDAIGRLDAAVGLGTKSHLRASVVDPADKSGCLADAFDVLVVEAQLLDLLELLRPPRADTVAVHEAASRCRAAVAA